MNGAIEEIIKINQADDPDDPGAYTEAWVLNMCSRLRKTPEEFLAKMKANRAAVSLIDQEAFKLKSDKKALEDPEYFEYMTGPIDGLSYRLMKKSEGLDETNKVSMDSLVNAYRAKFGSLPIGIGYPELTAELLLAAIESGKEIEPLPVPDGADV